MYGAMNSDDEPIVPEDEVSEPETEPINDMCLEEAS
jgi:hypothetical protein